jgi:hypothetical protein
MHIFVHYVNEIVKLHKNKFDLSNHIAVKIRVMVCQQKGAIIIERQAFCIHLGPKRVTVSRKCLAYK